MATGAPNHLTTETGPPPPRRHRLVTRLRGDRAGGTGLALASVAAMVWANWPGNTYARFWRTVAPWSAPIGLHLDLRTWVNEGALVAFFALVGLEIRREVTAGELRHVRRATVPVLAALAGMALPAGIYALAVGAGPAQHGWGIPMATDVAFALGALALVARAPARARVFLMTLAVADDVFSIVILVVFYNRGVNLVWLAGGLAALAVAALVWARRLPGWALRVGLVAFCWWALLHAGIEAAVTGVALGVLGPARPRRHHRARVRAWESRLEPWVNVAVLPLFALANIGITLSASTLTDAAALRVFVSVVLARVIGKPVGITAGALLTRRVLADVTQPRISRRRLAGVGALASIGFTVPLLVIAEAFPAGPLATAAVAGLLASTLVGAAIGAALFARTTATLHGARRPTFPYPGTLPGDTVER